MEYKEIFYEAKIINEREVAGIASVFNVRDSYGDIVEKGAFTKTIKEHLRRIKFLWQHDFRLPPVAMINEVNEISKRQLPKQVRDEFPEATGGLEVTREYLDTQMGNDILKGIKQGAINEMSIGYDPVRVKYDKPTDGTDSTRYLQELRLWDLSDVNWGANAATVAQKKVIPFKETPPADEGTSWDAGAEVKKSEVADLKIMCAWYDEDDKESKSAYKLPHHQKNDSYNVVWNGVKAAMGALLGARGGIDVPEGDRKAIYNHLSKHYKAWDKEPPDFKLIELIANANQLLDSGQVDKKTIRPLLDFAEQLISAEPERKIETPPLTLISQDQLRAIKTRLELAARMI